jgi:trimeric autotransporter adhesin
MNKSYKTVWNETTGTYVAASEVAKSKGKSSRNTKALVAALLAAGIGFGTAVKSEAAATPNSFAAGILGTDTSDSGCISSANGATVTTNGDCGAATQQAGIVSYNSSGTAGSYFTVTDPNTAHIGAGGTDQLRITDSGLFALNNMDMGGKTITNLAAGSVSALSTDAMNGSQLYGLAASDASALGGGSSVTASGAISVPSYVVGGTTVNNVGAALTNIDGRTTANTSSIAAIQTTVNNVTTSNAGIKYFHTNGGGNDSVATGGSAIAIGNNATASGNNSISIATSTYASIASGSAAIAMGANQKVQGLWAIGIGADSTLASTGAIGIGQGISVSGTDSIGIGQSASATGNSAVALGQGSVATRDNTVSVGSVTATRQVVNVAAGTQSTDAINVGQLQAAGLKTDSSGKATNSFVAYDDTTAGKVTLGGASGTTLTNVAAGAVSASSTDAVNGSQLYATNQSVAQNAAAIVQNSSDITQNGSDIVKNASDISQNTSDIAQNSSDVARNTSDIGTLNTQVSSLNGEMANAVQYDTLSHDRMTLGGGAYDSATKTGGTTITNVARGLNDSDAVNMSQLNETNTSVTTLGTQVTDIDGRVTQNTGDIAKNTGDISVLNSQIASLGGGVAGAVTYDGSAHDKVTLGGASGTTLTNVAAGAVSAESTDAVNGSQLYATNQSVTQNAATIAQNSSDISQNASDIAQNTGDITNLDTRVSTVEGSVSDLTNQLNNGAVGLVQQDPSSGDLTVAGSTGGTHVNFVGSAGPRELIGVAAGTTSNSAVNLGQLNPVVASLGGGAQVNADGSIVSPTYHMQGGTQNTVGGALDTLDTNLTSLETQINNGSIGIVTQDPTSRDILVGAATDGLRVNMAGTTGNRVVTGVAAGAVNADSVDAVNGSQLHANAASTAAALGGGASVNADGTVSAPSYSVGGTTVNNVGAAITNLDGRVTQNTSDIASLQTTVGSISGSVANAVSYDTSVHNQVTLGGAPNAPAVKLTNLQEGELSATSTDAVTGSQLWNTNQQLSDLSQSVQNQQQTGNQAMSIGTGSGPAAVATGSNAMALGGGSQASGDNSVAIGSNSVADEANTVSVGSQGNERRITNVAPGKSATDAVNLGQMQSAIGDTARAAYSGVAAATALTMIPEVDAGKTLAVGVAGATYKGYQAAAIGASARITANLKVKVGAGISGSETTVGAGASYQW